MHASIYVVSKVGDKQGFDADDVFDILEWRNIYYVKAMDENDQRQEKKNFMKILKEIVGDALIGDENRFSFTKAVKNNYAKHIMPTVKKAVQGMELPEFSNALFGGNLLDNVLPYKDIFIIAPRGSDVSLAEFLRYEYISRNEFYVEAVFDFHSSWR